MPLPIIACGKFLIMCLGEWARVFENSAVVVAVVVVVVVVVVDVVVVVCLKIVRQE